MEGIGEQFGKSVDGVIRRPRVVLVPLAIDLLVLLMGTVIFVAVAKMEIFFPQGYRLPAFPVAVAHALPTVGDIMGPTPSPPQTDLFLVAALVFVALTAPLLAYAEAGFLGVLRAVYLEPIDVVEEGRHPDAWSRIREAFTQTARRHFRPFFFLRLVQALLAIAAILLQRVDALHNYSLGVLAVDVMLLYAPYVVVDEGKGFIGAVRGSVQLVSDHLATTLVALLFGFLLTGGMALLVGRLALGVATPFVASVLYAPVGTVLALFLYHVYRGFRPPDAIPEKMPAPTAAPAGAA